MRISVIIVSWNAKAFLLHCLASIQSQQLSSAVEVIVVDNASSDGSPEAVKAQFPEVTLICNQQNYGFAKANNMGIMASQGDYLFLINSDVIVGPDCFARMLEYMNQQPEIGVLGPKIVGSNGRVQRSCMRYPSLWNATARALALDSLLPRSTVLGSHLLTFWAHDETCSVDVINGCFWLIRRTAIEKVGLLDEQFFIYGEDIDWCRRFTEFGWKVVFFPEADAVHYGGASSSNAPVRFYLEMQRANYQYWLKHHSRAASDVFLLINLLHHSLRTVGEVVAFPLSPKRRQTSSYKIARNIASIKWAAATLCSLSRRQIQGAERAL
jgi:GT2 family glycosyltransferase